MPTVISEDTESIASTIEKQYGGQVSRVTLLDLSDLTDSQLADNVVILASLDNDLFFDAAVDSLGHYEAVQRLLTGSCTNMVWATRGASKESQNPQRLSSLAWPELHAARTSNSDS